MQAQFEDVFKQMSAATGESATAPAESAAADKPSKPEDPTAADASFQETIRRTMERMQNSGEQATAAAASGSEDDFMAEMLKQLSSGAVGGEGGEEDFSKMLMGMMEQLTNKEILYEPMKELHDKFPEWLEKNRATTSKEDLDRYELQQGIVAEIVTKFEDKSYKDSNPADREYIVDRMQKVSASGIASSPINTNATRCKQQGRRLPTWLGTCHLHRMPLTCQTISVIHNRSPNLWTIVHYMPFAKYCAQVCPMIPVCHQRAQPNASLCPCSPTPCEKFQSMMS